jgi:hypothetical protein
MPEQAQPGKPVFSNFVLRIPADVSGGSERGGHLCFDADIKGAKAAHVAVYLRPALTSLLLELAKAYQDDRSCPEPARGWCQKEDLAKKRYVEKDSVKKDLSRIRGRIREEVRLASERLPMPQILETRPKSGVRVTCPIRIEKVRRN